MLIEGQLLNDCHINYAQRLLHSQFPSIHGLGHTLLQDREKLSRAYRSFLIGGTIGLYHQILAVIMEL